MKRKNSSRRMVTKEDSAYKELFLSAEEVGALRGREQEKKKSCGGHCEGEKRGENTPFSTSERLHDDQ